MRVGSHQSHLFRYGTPKVLSSSAGSYYPSLPCGKLGDEETSKLGDDGIELGTSELAPEVLVLWWPCSPYTCNT